MKISFNRKARRGFTLIELLIVIGILGALSALVLPSMLADRTAMLEKVCDYNNASTMRILKQYQQFTGKLPNGLHTGLQDSASHTPMDGMPDAQVPNVTDASSSYVLTGSDVSALNGVGISSVAYDTGLNSVTVADGINVMRCTPDWVDDEGNEYQFAGESISELEETGAKVLVFYVTPTVDWSGTGTSDWGEGNVKVSLDVPGQCPVPVDEDGVPDFRYYMAYVGVWSDGAQVSVTSSATEVPTPSLAGQDMYATMSDAETACEAIVGAADSNMSWQTGGDWTQVGATNQYQQVADYDDGGTTGTVTFTITDHDGTGVAKLLGTSCPECGVLNP